MPAQAKLDAGFTPEEAKTVKIFKGKGCAVATAQATKAAPVCMK